MTSTKSWFPTLIYSQPLIARATRLNAELLRECLRLREVDEHGRKWSASSYPGGYTSYGSMDRLHQFSSTFDELRRALDAHAKRYAGKLDWNLKGGKLLMTDCWVNIMPRGCAHSFHLHPQAVISGTYYVRTPRGCSGLKFEDPRLANFMATPPRKNRPAHIEYPAKAGNVILFESWLRHEVPASRIDEERVSISFNYHWV